MFGIHIPSVLQLFLFPEVGGVAKKDDDVEIVDEDEDDDEEVGQEVVVVAANQLLLDNPDKLAEPKQQIRAKLIQFHDNQRPPYWGTW